MVWDQKQQRNIMYIYVMDFEIWFVEQERNEKTHLQRANIKTQPLYTLENQVDNLGHHLFPTEHIRLHAKNIVNT